MSRVLRASDLTRAVHLIRPYMPVRTTVAEPGIYQMRMPATEAAELLLAGPSDVGSDWERASAWLSAMAETPVSVCAVEPLAGLRGSPGSSRPQWVNVTIRPAAAADRELAEAVRADHPCEDRTCDVAMALEQGYPQVAASLLMGATDTPALDDLTGRGRASVPANSQRCRGWEDWADYHARSGRRCPSCGAVTYGSDDWTPAACGECRQPLGPADPDADWEADLDTETWRAPGASVPDPVGGFGNLAASRAPGPGGEVTGDSPYRAALAALDFYAVTAAGTVQATQVLEARLTMHGFDRDQALMTHVSALREAAARLQALAASARAGLFMRHAVGAEYHASGRDAASTALRRG